MPRVLLVVGVNMCLVGLLLLAMETTCHLLLKLDSKHEIGEAQDSRRSNNVPPMVKDHCTGYRPKPDTDYTDAYGRRLTPLDAVCPRTKYAVFFGCSFTYGQGVPNQETLPARFGAYALDYRPYNYGIPGHGTHGLLAMLSERDLRAEIKEADGIAFYVFVFWHINRAVGHMQMISRWGSEMPFFTLNNQGQVLRHGSFLTGRPIITAFYKLLAKSQTVEYFEVDLPVIGDKHIDLAVNMIAAAKSAYSKKFGNDNFVVVIWPDPRNDLVLSRLDQAGIRHVNPPNMHLLEEKRFMLKDGHPNAEAYDLLAKILVREVITAE